MKTTEARSFAAARLTIPVSVFDQNGEFVRSIPSDSFKLLVDGQEVPITSVTTDPQPVSLVLIVDMSPSGEDQKKERFAYANSLIDSLGPEDKAIVFSLTTKLKQRSELTGDKEALKKAVSKLGMGDGTAIYDALREFYSTHLPTVPGRKAVVLLTDGVDTTSRESTFSDSLEFAERFEVPAFPIFFDTYPDMIKRQKALPPILQELFSAKQRGQMANLQEQLRQTGIAYLNDLVMVSGGRAIDHGSAVQGVGQIKTTIPDEVRNQYLLKAEIPEGSNPRARISVKVLRPSLKVRARGSFLRN